MTCATLWLRFKRLIGLRECYMELDRVEGDWGEERFGPAPRKPQQPRVHQKNIDSAFIVAVFLATVALILCAVR